MEVVADLPGFARATQQLRAAGCSLVLNGVDHGTMLLAALERLEPDWVKLDWSPRLQRLPALDRSELASAMARIGLDRLILGRAETEAALAWGMTAGIRCFQGRYVDTILAAERLKTCSHAAACTMRQCMDRAAATDLAGQAGCFSPALLDRLPPGRPA